MSDVFSSRWLKRRCGKPPVKSCACPRPTGNWPITSGLPVTREECRREAKDRIVCLPPDHEVQPARPNVGPGMNHDVRPQIPAPRGQYSKQNSKHADHDHILPTLIRMEQTKH